MNSWISAGAGLVCLAIGAGLWYGSHGRWPRITLVFFVAGVVGLANTLPVVETRKGFTWAATSAGRLLGNAHGPVIAASTIIGAIGLFFLVVVCLQAWHTNVSLWTFTFAAIVVTCAGIMPGGAGTVTSWLVNFIAAIPGLPVAWLIGQI